MTPRSLVSPIPCRPPTRLRPRVVWSLLGETFSEWYADRAPRLGAALAYYTVFALAPGLILIIALAGLLLGTEAAQNRIITQVRDLPGEAGPQVVRAAIESARDAGGSLLGTSLGAVALLAERREILAELERAGRDYLTVREASERSKKTSGACSSPSLG
jgi:membrane protein